MNTCDIKHAARMFLIISALFTTNVDAGGRRSTSDLLSATFSRPTSVRSLALAAQASLPSCDVNAITATGPALVFHDPALLANDFAFRTALQKIIDTSNETTVTSPEAFVATMLSSYTASERTNVDANLRTPVDVRTGEASMNPTALVAGMIPVAVFNRFDLTPTDGSNCGEHRIVYAKPDGAAGLPTLGRFLIILEAAYPNPSPSQGLAGCIPVASFWAGLADPTLTDAVRVGRLRDFFFNGITQDGVALPPVVAFEHYRGSLGQIRTNNFINEVDWQLREFHTGIGSSGQAELVVDTVRTNPRAEFYNINFTDTLEPQTFSDVRAEFRTDFLANQIPALVAPESAGLTDPIAIISVIGVDIINRFNEFQATSQGTSDKPAALIDSTLRSAIQSSPALTGLNLTDVHMINRASATTCGGCHRFARDEPISPTLNWPADAGFVHVTELGELSAALQNFFLPARERVLENFVCNPPPPVRTVPRMQVGIAKIKNTGTNGGKWTTVSFAQTFASAPAVFITPSSAGGTGPCDTRVRNVTASGFEVACLEPPNLDGLHGAMSVPFLAIEQGEFSADGKDIEVSCHTVGSVQGKAAPSLPKSWTDISFSTAFNSQPIVLSHILSDTNNVLQGTITAGVALWMTPAIRNVTLTGFQAALDLAEVPATSVLPETVCYAAFEQGSINFADSSNANARCVAATGSFKGWDNACLSTTLSEPFAAAPLLIGSMNTRNNSDGGWARQKCASTGAAVSFVIDEDSLTDRERTHPLEGVGFLACERAFSN
jgi:hypothetical protein